MTTVPVALVSQGVRAICATFACVYRKSNGKRIKKGSILAGWILRKHQEAGVLSSCSADNEARL
jgi:hypothetical protein